MSLQSSDKILIEAIVEHFLRCLSQRSVTSKCAHVLFNGALLTCIVSVVDQMTMCNIKVVTHRDKFSPNYAVGLGLKRSF